MFLVSIILHSVDLVKVELILCDSNKRLRSE